MNSIQNYAVMNGEINRENLSYLLNELNNKHYVDLDHMIAILLGLERPLDNYDFPEKSLQGEDKCATFKDYDALRDTVTYRYPIVLERWFATEDEKNRFISGESYFGMDYNYSENESHKFYGVRTLEGEGVCSSTEWLKNAAE